MSRKNLLIALAIGMAVSARGVTGAADVFFPRRLQAGHRLPTGPAGAGAGLPTGQGGAGVRSGPDLRAVRAHASHFAARKHRPLQHVKHSLLAHHSERHCLTYATEPIGPQSLKASGQPSPARSATAGAARRQRDLVGMRRSTRTTPGRAVRRLGHFHLGRDRGRVGQANRDVGGSSRAAPGQ